MMKRLVIFLVINFTALGIGGFFTGPGVASEWYTNLNQAPWTPPGWVFGTAWTTIMICFAIYMAYLFDAVVNKQTLILLFGLQWLLNVIWNPIFFHFQNTLLGLVIISSLTIVVFTFYNNYFKALKKKSFLILPYLIWLLIATSLNAYIIFNS